MNTVIAETRADGTFDVPDKKWRGVDEAKKVLLARDWGTPMGTLRVATHGPNEPICPTSRTTSWWVRHRGRDTHRQGLRMGVDLSLATWNAFPSMLTGDKADVATPRQRSLWAPMTRGPLAA